MFYVRLSCDVLYRASVAGSAIQVILPLALIVWLMRRSGMMGVSYTTACMTVRLAMQ